MGEPGADGRFGRFGGRFVPEALVPACQDLEREFRAAWSNPAFKDALQRLAPRLRRPAQRSDRVPQPLQANSVSASC